MTPASALEALIDQLVAAGLTENPAYTEDGGGVFVDRGFSIKEGKGKNIGGRGRADAAGVLREERFAVMLTHVLNPSLGQRARVPAYNDLVTAERAINAPGTALTKEGQVTLGDPARKLRNGGAVLTQTFLVRVSFSLDMRTP